jgi:hypothetical protein
MDVRIERQFELAPETICLGICNLHAQILHKDEDGGHLTVFTRVLVKLFMGSPSSLLCRTHWSQPSFREKILRAKKYRDSVIL